MCQSIQKIDKEYFGLISVHYSESSFFTKYVVLCLEINSLPNDDFRLVQTESRRQKCFQKASFH